MLREASPSLPRVGVSLSVAVILVALLGAFTACARAPVTGRHQLMLVSEAQADQLGLQAYDQILAQSKISHDPVYVDQVTRVGERLARAANRPNDQWQFAVIDDPKTINAFALPGGKVAVYTGLLNLHLSDAELAAVLGHEIGHVLAQHTRERLSEQLGVKLGLDLAGLSGRLGPNAMQAVDLAVGIGIGLPFERRQETEADDIGLDLMARAGYDPRAAVALWKKMMAAAGPSHTPELLSTHPSDEQRIRNIEAALPRVMPIYEQHKIAMLWLLQHNVAAR